jgi:flagellar motor protein MotB
MAKVVVKRKVIKPKGKSNIPKGGASVVIESKHLPVDQLQPYHENPNIGDPEKTAESLRENGQYRAIVVNLGNKTGRHWEILAGNHTWMGMKKIKHPTIYCDIVDEDEDGAEAIMLADNASRDGSSYKQDLLGDILQRRKKRVGTLTGTTISNDLLDGLLKKNSQKAASDGIDSIADAPDQLGGVEDLQNGVLFPSDLDFEIPELKLSMIPTKPPEPMKVWAGHELDGKDVIGEEEWRKMNWLAMWHAGSRGINWKKAIPYFYTDDFHFEPIFNDPAKNTKKILTLGIQTSFMPNYSVGPALPVAYWVWAVYRSYYVARYFQEAGIKVIPDIHTGMDDAALDLTLIGIPQKAPVVAAQCQQTDGDIQAIRKKARLLKEAEDRLHFKNIIIYGHTDADDVIERADFSANVIKISARTARRREYLNSGSTINSQKIVKRKRKVKK